MPPACEDDQAPGPVVEVLYVEHCPNIPAALALVERVAVELGLAVVVRTNMVTDQTTAERVRFVGSPTVRVDGCDVDPEGELAGEYTLECRLYWHQHHLAGYPQEHLVREALLRAAGRA